MPSGVELSLSHVSKSIEVMKRDAPKERHARTCETDLYKLLR